MRASRESSTGEARFARISSTCEDTSPSSASRRRASSSAARTLEPTCDHGEDEGLAAGREAGRDPRVVENRAQRARVGQVAERPGQARVRARVLCPRRHVRGRLRAETPDQPAEIEPEHAGNAALRQALRRSRWQRQQRCEAVVKDDDRGEESQLPDRRGAPAEIDERGDAGGIGRGVRARNAPHVVQGRPRARLHARRLHILLDLLDLRLRHAVHAHEHARRAVTEAARVVPADDQVDLVAEITDLGTSHVEPEIRAQDPRARREVRRVRWHRAAHLLREDLELAVALARDQGIEPFPRSRVPCPASVRRKKIAQRPRPVACVKEPDRHASAGSTLPRSASPRRSGPRASREDLGRRPLRRSARRHAGPRRPQTRKRGGSERRSASTSSRWAWVTIW